MSNLDSLVLLTYFSASVKKLIKTILPILICIAIFVYIFYKVPPKQALEALLKSHIGLFTVIAVLYFFWVHVFDALTIKHFLCRFATPISHKDSWLVRGVSYLIMILNYHAAQGAFALYLKKTHKAPISKTLGIMAFISLADLVLILTSAVIALMFTNVTYAGFDFRDYVLKLAPLIYIGYILFVLMFKYTQTNFMQKLAKFKIINWALNHNLFLIFREAKLKDYIILFVMRTPIIVAVVGGYNLALYAFDAIIPWKIMFLYNPLIMLIATMPITPSGLGTGQFFVIEFFQNHLASASQTFTPTQAASLLLASSLIWFIANQVIKVIFGAISLFMANKVNNC